MNRQPRVEVQHWVRAILIQQPSARLEFNLFEVAIDYTVPADTEFPRIVTRLDMFLRVVSRRAGPTRVRIRVHHENRPGRWDLRYDVERVQNRLLLPSDRVVFHDRPFCLAHVSLGGTGLYAVSIYFRPVDEPEEPDEFFWRSGRDPLGSR